MTASTARTVNPRGSGERLRSEILVAATRLLTASDVGDGVTLRAIAREASIAAPSIYPHFADRNAILDAVVAQTFEQLRAVCSVAAEAASSGSGADEVRAIAHAYLRFAIEQPGLYRVLFGRGPADVSGRRYDRGIDAFELLVTAMTRSAAEASVPGADAQLDAQVLWTALHGLVTLIPATSGFPWRESEALLDRILAPLTVGPIVG